MSQPLLPRRARYPGSRALRLGTPAGNNLYNLKVCTHGAAADAGAQARTCADLGGTVIMDEKLFVHGSYHFGVRMHFGYSYFPVSRLVGRRTPVAESAGENVFEVVESSGGTADYDGYSGEVTFDENGDPQGATIGIYKYNAENTIERTN